MLECGYTGGAELLYKLTVHRLFAFDFNCRIIVYGPLRGRVSAQAAHLDEIPDVFESAVDVLAPG